MKIAIIAYSILAIAVSTTLLNAENARAAGPSSCPAFTTEMVDAAAMAFGLDAGHVGSISVGDDPTTPAIFCNIVGVPSSDGFWLEVNYSAPSNAFVDGWHQAEGESYNAELFSFKEQLTLPQLRACRAAILKSFVWRNYCAPELQ